MTKNLKMSTSDQRPEFPSSADFDYVYGGTYYGWRELSVSLRANSTGTQPGFTLSLQLKAFLYAIIKRLM